MMEEDIKEIMNTPADEWECKEFIMTDEEWEKWFPAPISIEESLPITDFMSPEQKEVWKQRVEDYKNREPEI